MVCPHDTASNPDKWFQLAQYLSKQLSKGVQFSQSIDFAEYHQKLTEGALIYANPQDSLKLIKEHGYIPIVRPSNIFDEIVFIAGLQNDNPSLEDINGDEVISVNSMMVTRVGIAYLFENNISPSIVYSQSSWMAVVKNIFREKYKFGMVYKDFYDGLNKLTKKGFTTLGQTSDGTVHHSILIASEFKDMVQEIQTCLVNMFENNDRGQKILHELGFDRFVAINVDNVIKFETLSTLGDELMRDEVY
jgi:phosphonate transport system substrate-binding protein